MSDFDTGRIGGAQLLDPQLQELARLRDLAQAERGLPLDGAQPAAGGGFGDLLAQQVAESEALKHERTALAQAFEMGDPGVSLVDVMIAAQKSSVSFQALTEVRNKFLSAYQEIMSMSV